MLCDLWDGRFLCSLLLLLAAASSSSPSAEPLVEDAGSNQTKKSKKKGGIKDKKSDINAPGASIAALGGILGMGPEVAEEVLLTLDMAGMPLGELGELGVGADAAVHEACVQLVHEGVERASEVWAALGGLRALIDGHWEGLRAHAVHMSG